VHVLANRQREQRRRGHGDGRRVGLDLLVKHPSPLFVPEAWLVVVKGPDQVVQFGLPRRRGLVRAGCVVWNGEMRVVGL